MASELHGEVTSEPIGRLHNDGLYAVGCQPLQHLGKAWALVDTVGTAHGLVHEGEPRTLGERLNSPPLMHRPLI